MTTRWIKIPGHFQYRGEGEWQTIEEAGCTDDEWEATRDTGYLPTHEGDEPPDAVQADGEA